MIRFLKNYLFKLNWLLFFKLNFCSKNITRKKGKYILPLRGTIIKIHKSAKIQIDGQLTLNYSHLDNGNTFLLLEPNALLHIQDDFDIYYKCDIAVYKDAELRIGGGFINAGSQIRCSKSITIGNQAAIAREVIIIDSDSHHILDSGHDVSKPVTIGNHVWLCTRSMVIKGVNIGDGAILAAGAIATKDIDNSSVAAGIPAKVVKTNVQWK